MWHKSTFLGCRWQEDTPVSELKNLSTRWLSTEISYARHDVLPSSIFPSRRTLLREEQEEAAEEEERKERNYRD